MKASTMLGVLGAAAAVAAFAIAAPGRAAEVAPRLAGPAFDTQDNPRPGLEPAVVAGVPAPSTWVLAIGGVLGLGVLLRAGRDGMVAN